MNDTLNNFINSGDIANIAIKVVITIAIIILVFIVAKIIANIVGKLISKASFIKKAFELIEVKLESIILCFTFNWYSRSFSLCMSNWKICCKFTS